MRSLSFALVALAVLAVLFSAAPAFAATGNGRYLDWSEVATLPGQGSSPHGGYATSTKKCAVCHSTHTASSSPGSEVLLQSSAADACIYCHVNTASSYTQVYEGDSALYSGADYPNGHNVWVDSKDVVQGVMCTTCHSVHAPETQVVTSAALSAKLLRKLNTPDPIAGQIADADSKDVALTKWCAGCHFSIGSGSYFAPGHQSIDSTVAYTSHIMTTATAGFDNPAASYNGRVAFKDSSACSSCHSSGYNTPAFPHYTEGVRMLETAANASATPTPSTSSTEDGVCLRCHRDGVGNGVGGTY